MRTILLIEDDPFTRSFAVRTLAAPDTAVLQAVDGHEGVSLAIDHPPVLVLCDIELPGLDGYGVLAELRRDPRTRHVPFIFLTGHTKREDIRRGMELGADDYITKPFTADELRAAVSTRLAKHDAGLLDRNRALDEIRRVIVQTFPHELRTPLNVIMGACQLLKEESISGDGAGERRDTLLNSIESATERLNRLAENFLILTRFTGGSCQPESDSGCSHRLIQPAGLIIIRASNTAVRVKRENDLKVSAEDVPIHTAPDDLDKIIEELVRNALGYSPPGSPVHVTAKKTGDAYCVSIADSGRGMNTDDIARVAPFQQFDRSRYEQQGLGLGLAIASRLAERHGGHLTIESTPGLGTTVTVSLVCVE